MECRNLKITLVSATDLPDVRNLGQMKVYAKVSIKGDSKTTKKTPADMQGETNPRWNFSIDYAVGEKAVWKKGLNIDIRLYCKRTFGHDRFIGEVNVPIKSLFDRKEKALTYPVGGTPNGKLNLLYSFGEKIVVQRSSGWKRALMFVEGVMVLLSNDDGSGDEDEKCEDVDFVRTEDGEIFYEVQSSPDAASS